jgi:hypothetical protein
VRRKQAYLGDLRVGRTFIRSDGSRWKVIKRLAPSCIVVGHEVEREVQIAGKTFVKTQNRRETLSCGALVALP